MADAVGTVHGLGSRAHGLLGRWNVGKDAGGDAGVDGRSQGTGFLNRRNLYLPLQDICKKLHEERGFEGDPTCRAAVTLRILCQQGGDVFAGGEGAADLCGRDVHQGSVCD